jgi:hypothetical protein
LSACNPTGELYKLQPSDKFVFEPLDDNHEIMHIGDVTIKERGVPVNVGVKDSIDINVLTPALPMPVGQKDLTTGENDTNDKAHLSEDVDRDKFKTKRNPYATVSIEELDNLPDKITAY